MTLPEIPEVALLPAVATHAAPHAPDPFASLTDFDGMQVTRMRAALMVAWPFLYAAALHHAADHASASREGSEGWRIRADELRRMADEATRQCPACADHWTGCDGTGPHHRANGDDRGRTNQ